jgi:CheY-like chemotaxis protein
MVPDNISSSASQADLSAPEGNSQICVLLVEDDRALRRYLEVLLGRAGYKVITAADGLEAMKIVVTTKVDVVVTDAMMPNLNGHELCRFLRNSPSLAQLPVIMLSALERNESDQNASQANAFLAKPVSGESLIECIEELLTRTSE